MGGDRPVASVTIRRRAEDSDAGRPAFPAAKDVGGKERSKSKKDEDAGINVDADLPLPLYKKKVRARNVNKDAGAKADAKQHGNREGRVHAKADGTQHGNRDGRHGEGRGEKDRRRRRSSEEQSKVTDDKVDCRKLWEGHENAKQHDKNNEKRGDGSLRQRSSGGNFEEPLKKAPQSKRDNNNGKQGGDRLDGKDRRRSSNGSRDDPPKKAPHSKHNNNHEKKGGGRLDSKGQRRSSGGDSSKADGRRRAKEPTMRGISKSSSGDAGEQLRGSLGSVRERSHKGKSSDSRTSRSMDGEKTKSKKPSGATRERTSNKDSDRFGKSMQTSDSIRGQSNDKGGEGNGDSFKKNSAKNQSDNHGRCKDDEKVRFRQRRSLSPRKGTRRDPRSGDDGGGGGRHQRSKSLHRPHGGARRRGVPAEGDAARPPHQSSPLSAYRKEFLERMAQSSVCLWSHAEPAGRPPRPPPSNMGGGISL